MKTNMIMVSSILFFTFLLSAGCTNTSDNAATISVHSESEYVKTFEDLDLGLLFNFDFTLQEADKRWINLWVERYIDGEKDEQALTQLFYGSSPNEVLEGDLGFGVINPHAEETLAFLYGPDVRQHPSPIEIAPDPDGISAWEYAIGDKEVELELDETKILAAYREREGNSISTVDFHDEDAVNRMIEQEKVVLLLKISIEEES